MTRNVITCERNLLSATVQYVYKKRSGFVKHLTIKNCDKTFCKSIHEKFVDHVSMLG